MNDYTKTSQQHPHESHEAHIHEHGHCHHHESKTSRHHHSCADTHGGHHHHHHAHAHGHHHHHHGDTKNIQTAFWLNLFFAIFELIGGFFANSMAILSDAVHDLGDSLSLGVAWYLQKVSHRGRNHKFSYGYKRFSLLGALFISVLLAVGSSVIIIESIPRLLNPVVARPAIMLAMAVVGLAVNGFAAYRVSKGSSINERAVMLHLLEDVLGWLAVLVVSIVMYFTNLPILDPILSIAISIWVLINVGRNLYATFHIMLQAVPSEVDTDALQNDIMSLPLVDSLHDFHLWTLDGEKHILSLHLVLPTSSQSIDCSELKEEVRAIAHSYGIDHVTIEIDLPGHPCGMENC